MGSRIRFSILILGALIGFGGLLFRLYDLQLHQGALFAARASSQFVANQVLHSPRGVIYFTDKNGNRTPVALNREFPVVYAVPREIEDVEVVLAKLMPLFPEADKEALTRRMRNEKSAYVLFSKKTDKETVKKIEALELDGVYVDSQAFRYYTLGNAASHLLGFVGPDAEGEGQSGHYGVEEIYEKQLQGAPGDVKDGKITFSKRGEELVLTIDPNIQAHAQTLLTNLVRDFDARGGSIVVQEPQTGKILALVNGPTFDPNNYGEASIEAFKNGAVQEQYEPGSVVKVLTMAAGIDAGKITPQTVVHDSGVFNVSGHKIRNWDLKAHGDVTATNVIEKSLNVGTAKIEQLIGHSTFKKYIKAFGFGEKTEIDLPGELTGDVKNLLASDAPEIAYATASFGQGIATTPLQVITAISSLANGGKLMQPFVNSKTTPKVVRQVISSDTARKVRQMMVTAVETNVVAVIKGYDIGAKTGTAQLASNGVYGDKVINTYVGFAPANDPRFTILVKLNEPAGAPLSGRTVVPVFRELAQFLLNYYEIPPTNVVN